MDTTAELTETDLVTNLRRAWSAETSAYEDWSSEVPEKGQCAVTALVVQDQLGGEILRAVVGDDSHYWNLLPSGRELDLTRGQFDRFEPVGTKVATREYILSYEPTVARYERLRRAAVSIG